MSERSTTLAYPHRDAHGRVVSLGQLLIAALVATVVGFVALVLIDGVFALIRIGTFGRASGWLAAILPALLFFDDVRAWRGYGIRYLVGLVGLAVALALGLFAAGLVHLPAVVSGAAGAAVAAAVYALVWFVGIRWLTGQFGEMESR